MEYLVFRLYGPLASWGLAAVGGDRPTGLYPSRSALIGIMAAGLGVKREDELLLEQLNSSIKLAVKQLVPSTLMRDYHTTQVPTSTKKVEHATRKSELAVPKLNTILSSRDYRCDGLWVVAVSLTTDSLFSLEKIEKALLTPVFTLYMGRKSCPLAVPLMPQRVQVKGVKDALDTHFPPLSRSEKEDRMWLGATRWVTYYWEGERAEFTELGVMTTQPWDNPISRTRWQFNQRTVHQVSVEETV